MHIVCPHCQAINRIPTDKSPLEGKCGDCHRPLFSGEPAELDAAGFARQLQFNDIPLLVDFWAAWCGPCEMMAPVFRAAAARLEPQLRFAKVDTERESQLAAQWSVRSIPTLILFKNGRDAARLAGALDLQRLLAWIQQQL